MIFFFFSFFFFLSGNLPSDEAKDSHLCTCTIPKIVECVVGGVDVSYTIPTLI